MNEMNAWRKRRGIFRVICVYLTMILSKLSTLGRKCFISVIGWVTKVNPIYFASWLVVLNIQPIITVVLMSFQHVASNGISFCGEYYQRFSLIEF